MKTEHIDFDKRIIKGKSGKIYKIAPEDISAGRWAEFEIRSIGLSFNTDFETTWKVLNEIEDVLMNGKNNAQGNVYHAISKIKEYKKGMADYQLNPRPKLIEFCSLFCVAEGEDKAIHNEDQIREKYNDWAHIPIADFFFLCANVIPSFKETLISTLQTEKENILKSQ